MGCIMDYMDHMMDYMMDYRRYDFPTQKRGKTNMYRFDIPEYLLKKKGMYYIELA